MTKREKRLGVWLSVEADDALRTMARRHHVSMTALIEGLGLLLARYDCELDGMRGRVDEWMELAAGVDEDRGGRSRSAD